MSQSSDFLTPDFEEVGPTGAKEIFPYQDYSGGKLPKDFVDFRVIPVPADTEEPAPKASSAPVSVPSSIVPLQTEIEGEQDKSALVVKDSTEFLETSDLPF